MDINIDDLYNILKQNQGDLNDALGYKKKTIVVTSDPLALVAEKTKVNKRKEQVVVEGYGGALRWALVKSILALGHLGPFGFVRAFSSYTMERPILYVYLTVVSSDSEGSGADDFSELKKITALLANAFNRRKFYSKPTNNNLRTSSTSQSTNKKQEFVKTDDKKVEKKADEKKRDLIKVKCYNCKKERHFAKDYKQAKVKDYNYYKTKMLLAKKDSDEQVLLAEDQAWMESSSDSNQEFNANMVFMAQIEKVLSESDESSSSVEETIAEVSYYTSESENYDKSEVDHNDSEEKEHLVDKLIRKFNHKIAKFQKRIEKANQQTKGLENQKKDSQDKYDVLINQVNTFEEQNNEFNEQIKVLNEKNADLLAQTKEERYEYMIRYSAICDNDKQHRKKIDEQEILFDKMSVQLVELDKHVRDLKNTVLEKDFKISELEECVRNKDQEIEKCLERLNVCENKIHKMGQTNQTVHMIMTSKDILYNGRKGIGFENPRYFEKAKDLRPSLYDEKVIGLGYTPMFLTHSNEALEIEKIKRSRENKIEFAYDYGNLNASYVNEKINFEDDYFQEIINPDFEKIDSPFQQTSSLKPYVPNVILEKIIIDLEDEVVNLLEKEKGKLETIESLRSKKCDKEENPKVIAPGMFKLNVSQCVSPISMTKSSCDYNNVKIKLKRKRHTFSSVTRPRYRDVIWKKKGSSNTSNVGLSAIVHICLWIIDSGCSKHMTCNRALLTNFVEKFLGTVRFG
nr:ribonuclease H-like domain-containing protein [Tanacetum cinerariifolium]